MDDLLKDAIADAKAVRETAIANAKLALEEAFTPKLQNMLSQKIQNEIEIDEEEKDEMEEERDDEVDEERDEKEEGKMRRDGDEMEEERDDEVDEERDDEVEEGEHEDDMEEGEHGDDELDLEAIIKELEAEINEEDEEEMEEGEERDDKKDEVKEEDEDDEDKDDIEENDVSSGIGKSDNAHDKKSGDSSGIGSAGKAKHESVDEEFDLDSILEALKEEEEVEEGEDKEVDEVAELRAELDETREAVKFMRDKLNEVNLLNAKLLFTNKLFRAYGLNNEQKMKVVETFDRASNIREVKLVYSTMAETFGAKKTEIKESKGSASKAVASTKSEKQGEVITEGNTMRDRFKKLANII